MQLLSLSIRNIRKLKTVDIVPSPTVNIVVGANGSGKTSLLEGIHLLATARSFRTSRITNVINRGESELLVHGDFLDGQAVRYRVGVEKTASTTRLRLNGKPLSVASQIARLVPIFTFNSESYLLLDGGPANRRALIDRLLFHVEQQYLDNLKAYYRVLKQRNQLLRNRAAANQIEAWTDQMQQYANRLDQYRHTGIETLNAYLRESLFTDLLGNIELDYRRGWTADESYAAVLEKNLTRDVESGNTTAGPHRAELRIKIDGLPAKSTVSRGQGKLIIAAIVAAQARFLNDEISESPILLVDDLAAELDRNARELAFTSIREAGAQVFFTAIDARDLPADLSDAAMLFHVEHGQVN